MRVSRLQPEDVPLVGTIDRSEHVDFEYRVIDGQLEQVPATIVEVPAWDPTGSGPFSVAAHIAFCASVVARGSRATRTRHFCRASATLHAFFRVRVR